MVDSLGLYGRLFTHYSKISNSNESILYKQKTIQAIQAQAHVVYISRLGKSPILSGHKIGSGNSNNKSNTILKLIIKCRGSQCTDTRTCVMCSHFLKPIKSLNSEPVVKVASDWVALLHKGHTSSCIDSKYWLWTLIMDSSNINVIPQDTGLLHPIRCTIRRVHLYYYPPYWKFARKLVLRCEAKTVILLMRNHELTFAKLLAQGELVSLY